jgi:trk system potassium uptake protein TrkA
MKVIIMGCGRVGSQLSRILLDDGHSVVVIDQDPSLFARLGSNFRGQTVQGVGFDRNVLIQAGIEQAEAFVSTSASDNANVIAARIARNVFHVPRVVARQQDPRRAEIYRRLGLITISPTHWGARRIYELLFHADLAPVMTFGNGEVALIAIDIAPQLVGRRVQDLSVPGEVSVVALTREAQAMLPTMGTEFHKGDVIHLAVLSSAMERLKALLD